MLQLTWPVSPVFPACKKEEGTKVTIILLLLVITAYKIKIIINHFSEHWICDLQGLAFLDPLSENKKMLYLLVMTTNILKLFQHYFVLHISLTMCNWMKWNNYLSLNTRSSSCILCQKMRYIKSSVNKHIKTVLNCSCLTLFLNESGHEKSCYTGYCKPTACIKLFIGALRLYHECATSLTQPSYTLCHIIGPNVLGEGKGLKSIVFLQPPPPNQ